MNKKIILTFSAIALFMGASAQEKRTESWPNGNKKSEGITIGKVADATGTKEMQARQSAMVIKDGKWTNWYESGKLRSEENYDKGTMTGAWKVWYEGGQVESEINFTTGKAVHFHPNGKKQSEGGIAPGMVTTGKWTGYHENGNKNYEGSYTEEGKKDGVWTWYDETGKITGTQTFNNGELVK